MFRFKINVNYFLKTSNCYFCAEIFYKMKKPSAYNTIEDIRNEIDHIDLSILKLLANRQEFIEEIVKYKTDQDSVIAEDRQKEVYAQRREWANDLQLNAAFIENIFKQLVQHNIERELKLLKNKP